MTSEDRFFTGQNDHWLRMLELQPVSLLYSAWAPIAVLFLTRGMPCSLSISTVFCKPSAISVSG